MRLMAVSIEARFGEIWESGKTMRIVLLPLLWGVFVAAMALPTMADETSHRASAERFLKLANAEGMTAPVYEQVSRLINAQFSQLGGSLQYEAVLRKYQQEARQVLDRELAWEAIRDELIDLYLPLFSEDEFNQLSAFYQSPAGRKLMQHLPQLTRQSMAISRTRVQERVEPRIQVLLEQMAEDVEARQQDLR